MKMSFGHRALDKIYKRRDRYEIPEWQRQEVWGRSKKQSLINSILRGWKIPKFYFLKTSDDPEEFEVVDGQQRLMAIFEFLDNQLALSPSSQEEFRAEHYSDLSDAFSDRFDDFEIEYDLIEEATDEEVKEFFQRLQQGLPLTGSEKLNSIHSNLRDFVATLSKHPFFCNKVVASDKRYGHFDIISKVSAIEIDGIDVGLRFDDLRAVFESQSNFSSESNVALRIQDTLDFLDTAFATRNLHLRNRTVVQSLISLTARLIASGKASGHHDALAAFFEHFMLELSRQVELGQAATDQDYLAFQRTVSANVKSGARTRQQIMLRKLLIFAPQFASILDRSDIDASGIASQIKTDAIMITKLVSEINQRYASTHGEDLFKPTNKTALAQIAVGDIVSSMQKYGDFIDNLYFLFHEGVGQRLAGQVPVSFKDVNTLRTAMRHDVDHGKHGEVKKKRQAAGSVFEKYAGAPTPETLAPESFSVAQASILAAIRADLVKMKASL